MEPQLSWEPARREAYPLSTSLDEVVQVSCVLFPLMSLLFSLSQRLARNVYAEDQPTDAVEAGRSRSAGSGTGIDGLKRSSRAENIEEEERIKQRALLSSSNGKGMF